jgi:hypothetical protein
MPELTPADHMALERLVVELLWRADHGQHDRLHELFVEDCEVVEYEMSEDGPVYIINQKGRKAVESNENHPGTGVRAMLHAVTNIRFGADGPGRALGNGIVIAFNDPDRQFVGTSLPRLVGEYDWTCARTEDGWRFVSVVCRKMFGASPR